MHWVLIITLISLFFLGGASLAQETPADSVTAAADSLPPNAIFLEMVGHGGLYSFAYERSLTPQLGLNLGVAFYPVDLPFERNPDYILTVPLNFVFYFSGAPDRFYLDVGTTMMMYFEREFEGGLVFPTLGAGYQMRRGPLMLRGGIVGMTIPAGIPLIPWPYFAAGYLF